MHVSVQEEYIARITQLVQQLHTVAGEAFCSDPFFSIDWLNYFTVTNQNDQLYLLN